MKLRKPCKHDLYDRHHLSEGLKVGDLTHCPGGESVTFGPDTIEQIVKAMIKVPFQGSVNRDYLRRLASAAFLVIDPES